jgi:hypothetical protein
MLCLMDGHCGYPPIQIYQRMDWIWPMSFILLVQVAPMGWESKSKFRSLHYTVTLGKFSKSLWIHSQERP